MFIKYFKKTTICFNKVIYLKWSIKSNNKDYENMTRFFFAFLIFSKYFIKSFINNSLQTNYKKGTLCTEMGLDRIKLNPFNINQIKIIQNPSIIDQDIFGIINYTSKKNLIICSNNILLINFIHFVLKKKFQLFSTKKLELGHKLDYILITDKNIVKNYLKDNYFIIDDLKIFDNLPSDKSITLLTRKNIINKNFNTYKYIKGRLFNLSSNNICNYYLITKENFLENIKINKISGFSSIKSFELFPFDLCYESILPHVDEFILGVDIAALNKKREKLLDNFLNQTKYRDKIKLVYLDFKTDLYKKIKSQGRWIANINNYLLNYCSGEYCYYIQADEFNNHKNLRKKLDDAIKINTHEINFNFFHYIFNLQTIRDPKYASYQKAIRFFKNENYLSIYDGYNFRPIRYSLFKKKTDKGFSIFHLSYILASDIKLKSNFSKKDGLFHNLTTKEKWLKSIFPIKAKDITADVNEYSYLSSVVNIIKESNKNYLNL